MLGSKVFVSQGKQGIPCEASKQQKATAFSYLNEDPDHEDDGDEDEDEEQERAKDVNDDSIFREILRKGTLEKAKDIQPVADGATNASIGSQSMGH